MSQPHPPGMTPAAPPASAGLAPLAAHLRSHRAALLNRWRRSVEHDPAMPDTSDWTEAQFLDHFPDVLEGVERILTVWPDPAPGLWRQQIDRAQAHARYRWLQGYTMRTIAQEWGSLNRQAVDEIARFYADAPDKTTLGAALQLWSSVLEHHLIESVISFQQVDQAEAATRAQELKDALHRLQSLNSESGEVVTAATQEIRERLAVAHTSASVIADAGVTEAERRELHGMLTLSLQSVGATLANVSALAQLEAGTALLSVGDIDVSETMELACSNLQSQLETHGADLVPDGPSSLRVEGDAVHLALLMQHLVLTACSAAGRGTITVKWGEDQRTRGRWFLNLSHPLDPDGSRATSATALALSEATRDAHRTERGPKNAALGEARAAAPISPMGSDGIHLAIAKRLCELMRASLEMEAAPDRLQYRVTLPCTYGDAEPMPAA